MRKFNLKGLFLACAVTAAIVSGCGSKADKEAGTTEGFLVEDLKGEELIEVIEEVSDSFVPTEETQKNVEYIAQMEKEREEARAHLGEVLTTEDYKYSNGTLTLTVEKNADNGKKVVTFKYVTENDDEYQTAFAAINYLAQSLIDSDFEAHTELVHKNDTYRIDMKSASDKTYYSKVGGAEKNDNSEMPEIKKLDGFSGAQLDLYKKIVADTYGFLKFV